MSPLVAGLIYIIVNANNRRFRLGVNLHDDIRILTFQEFDRCFVMVNCGPETA